MASPHHPFAIFCSEAHLQNESPISVLILQCSVLKCESVPVRPTDVRVIPCTATISGVIFHSQYTTWVNECPMTFTSVHCPYNLCIL